MLLKNSIYQCINYNKQMAMPTFQTKLLHFGKKISMLIKTDTSGASNTVI